MILPKGGNTKVNSKDEYKSSPKDVSFNIWPTFIAISIFALISLISVLTVYRSHFSGSVVVDHSAWGQFGDFFGGTLNPIFGLLSLIAILVTLIVQTKELKHSSTALGEQSVHLKNQAFENTFFAMLQICREGISNIEIMDDSQHPKGQRALRELWKRIEGIYKARSIVNSREGDASKRSEDCLIGESYELFFSKNKQYIGYYLRVIEQLFEFVENNAPENNPNQYWKIIRAQMSELEVGLLFYHAIANRDKYFPFVTLRDKGIFAFLPNDQLLQEELHGSFLNISETNNGASS